MDAIQIKRIYAPAEKTDGFRILIDRLWPRGVKKESAGFDVWMKEVAPSHNLRKQFHSDPEKWEKFSKEYQAELQNCEAVKQLIDYIKEHKIVTLLYASRNEKHNHAVILKKFLDEVLEQ